jgi:hypothetical protein
VPLRLFALNLSCCPYLAEALTRASAARGRRENHDANERKGAQMNAKAAAVTPET